MGHWRTLGVPPPRDPHDRVQSGRFLRDLVLRALLFALVVWAMILATGMADGGVVVIGSVALGLAALDVLWLTHRIRRAQRAS